MDTKKLRQKILDLAIHGKLVPQDPNDEPASVLLERIRAEKERLIAEGKIKRSKKSATSDTPHYENVPFEVPEGWCWCRLDCVGEIVTGSTPSKDNVDYYGGSIPFYKPTDLEQGINTIEASDSLTELGFSVSRKLPEQSILVTCIGATIGKTGLIQKRGTCNQQINAIISNNMVLPEYLYYTCISGYMQSEIIGRASATTLPILNKNKFSEIPIPVPPIQEQQRIISKIETLFSFVIELGNSEKELISTISKAKLKILDLAIHGKLVPQDANDEPALELLKRINPKAVASCDNPHYVGDIPSNWVWTTLGSIGKWQSGGTPSKMHKEYYGGNIPWLKTGDLNDGLVTDIPEHITELGLENSSAKLNPAGSVLIAMYGATIGKVGILGIPATTNQACCACIEYKGITQQHLFLFLLANKANFVAAGGGGAQPNISKEIITKTLIPLPPIEEQNRIVAKVKDLFSHLDMIEKSLQA